MADHKGITIIRREPFEGRFEAHRTGCRDVATKLRLGWLIDDRIGNWKAEAAPCLGGGEIHSRTVGG